MRITPAYLITIEDYTSKPMVIPFIRYTEVGRLLIEIEVLSPIKWLLLIRNRHGRQQGIVFRILKLWELLLYGIFGCSGQIYSDNGGHCSETHWSKHLFFFFLDNWV